MHPKLQIVFENNGFTLPNYPLQNKDESQQLPLC